MAVEAKIEPKTREAHKRLEEVKARMADLSPVLQGSAATLGAVILRSFSRSESPLGEKWAPLAQSTVKRRREGSSKPLIDTGNLRGSVATQATKDSVKFGVSGTAAEYGPVHQFGSVRIPRRRFLPVDASGEPDLSTGRAARWAAQQLKRIATYIDTGKL